MSLQVQCRNCAQYRNEWCNLKMDSPDPDMVRDCRHYRTLTNADRIRAMDDDALAGFLAQTSLEAADMEENKELKDKMISLWLDWLKQEVDNG